MKENKIYVYYYYYYYYYYYVHTVDFYCLLFICTNKCTYVCVYVHLLVQINNILSVFVLVRISTDIPENKKKNNFF